MSICYDDDLHRINRACAGQGGAGRAERRGRKVSKREMRWPRDGTSAMNRGVIILVTGKGRDQPNR